MRPASNGRATSLIVSVPRLAIRSRQVMTGVPSLVARVVRFASAAGRSGPGHLIRDRGALAGPGLVVGEQDRGQRTSHVELDVI